MSYKKAIVHEGRSHADEVFALGLAWYAGYVEASTPFERRQPTEAELNDPDILVLDVGQRHEPGLGNFDHHQLPRGTVECALSLLARDAGVHDRLWDSSPWYRGLVLRDSLGPQGMATALNLPYTPPPEYIDGMTSHYVALFEKKHGGIIRDVATAKDIVSYQILMSEQMAKRMIEIEHFEVVTYHGLRCLIMPDSNILGVNVWAKKNDIDMTTSPDNRDPENKISLYRYAEDRLDFSAIENLPGVHFAHKAGFLAVIDKDADIGDLVKKSIK